MRQQDVEQKGAKIGHAIFWMWVISILLTCFFYAACSIPVRLANERDAENKPIPVLATLDGKATTTDDTGKKTETVFHPAEVKPVPDPTNSWVSLLMPLLGLIPGIGGTLAVLLPRYLAARTAVKEVVAGVQEWKSDMSEDEKKEFNETLGAKQSPKTKDIIARHKGKK